MPAIVYCYVTPPHDENGITKPPENALAWTAWYPNDDEPQTVYVKPYIIQTEDEQTALHSLSDMAESVAALQMVTVRAGDNAIMQAIIANAEQLPRTLFGRSYKPQTLSSGIVDTSQGLHLLAQHGDHVLLTANIKKLGSNPTFKCCDEMVAPRIADAISRRCYERGLPFIPPAAEQPSCAWLKKYTLGSIARLTGQLLDSVSKYRGTELPEIPVKPLPAVNTATAKPTRPPKDEQPRYAWQNRADING